ncbi:MAG TPA: ABC transporter ATP-binding protein [Candidatus Stackebrandtia excrementipullorum]|nr:ABC transporter ATP-binding protein [Candidatus Stackebrandtia excrementipullorum]
MNHVAQLRSVSKSFGKVVALNGVSMDIERGEILTLVGPNGAGKTTLTSIVSTLLRPDSGDVIIDGVDVATDAATVRRTLALVPQGVAPDPFTTPREHVDLYLRARGVNRKTAAARTRELLTALDLWDRRDVRAQKLSGGYQRRVILAMALATRPKLLLLDEPTTALDPAARRQMWKMLTDVRDETSILITTHDMSEAQILSDRVAMLSDGDIVGTDTVPNLLKRLPATEKFVISGDTVPDLSRFGTVTPVAGRTVLFPVDGEASTAVAAELTRAGAEFARQSTDLDDCYFMLLADADKSS